MNKLLGLLLVVLLATAVWAEDAVSFRLNWYMGGAHAPFFLGGTAVIIVTSASI